MEIDEKLNAIKLDVIKMFETTIRFLNESLDSYIHGKEAPRIDDDKIDHLERSVEKECLILILKERPFSKDLRKVTGIFKLVEDIERLGDHAEDLSWTIAHLAPFSQGIEIPSLLQEAKIAMSMVEDSYRSFAQGDDPLALEVIKRDDVVDNLYLKSLEEIPKFRDRYSLHGDFILYATLMANYWERVADHASTIAEWVDYIETGYYKGEEIL